MAQFIWFLIQFTYEKDYIKLLQYNILS